MGSVLPQMEQSNIRFGMKYFRAASLYYLAENILESTGEI